MQAPRLEVAPLAVPANGEVHLWRASLDHHDDRLAAMAATLSSEERERGDRFHHELDRRRFTSARGWLRRLLAAYLDIEPAEVRLAIDTGGKPRLDDDSTPLRFNLSHSGALLVVATATGREIGVDVEEIREDVDIDAVSRRFMSARQHAELVRTAEDAQTAAFYALWTRTEAYLKGLGVGLLRGAHDVDATPGWSVASFDVGSRYAAAVAVEGPDPLIPAGTSDLAAL